MTTYESLIADYLLTRITGDPHTDRRDLRSLLGNVVRREVNHVIEDRGLGFSLLLGQEVLVTPISVVPEPPQKHFLWTPYDGQSRRPVTHNAMMHELRGLGFASPAELMASIVPSETIVVYWKGEICIAFQRLLQTGRWARRSYPLKYLSHVPLPDFLEGFKTGMSTDMEHTDPLQYALPYLETT